MAKTNDYLPVPIKCDSCQSPNVSFEQNDVLYGRKLGEWPYCYFCRDCRASVGVHRGTNKPFGRMATKPIRQLRITAHEKFDPIWKLEHMTRSDAYSWLASNIGIPKEECHISWMLDGELLKKIAVVSQQFLDANPVALVRRRKKQNARELEQRERHIKRFGQNRKHKEFKRSRRND